MNHSDHPNMEDFGEHAIAARDIAIGDEITCDYRIVKVWSFPVCDTDTDTPVPAPDQRHAP